MKVGIISPYPFPFGLAATNRIKAYSKALISQGVDVTVIVPEPRDNNCGNERKLPDEGVYDGISYIFPSGRYKSKSKILRGIATKSKFRFLYGVYKTLQYVKKDGNLDYIIISNDNPLYLQLYIQVAKSIGAKIIFIFDEYPVPIRHKLKSDIPNWKKFAYKNILKKVDGYISITENLYSYYLQFANKPGFIMSVIVDFEKFSVVTNTKKKHITYMGNMEISKDNVDLIIKAFSKISDSFPKYTLHLYGNPSSSTSSLLNNLIKDLGLTDRVFIEGKVKSDEVPEILNSSMILVSSQPNTLRAAGGFPTKLGEYLSTGVPTIVTDVGENSKDLVNMVDCIFTIPDDVKDYADKLEWVLSNYEDALKIAENGKTFIKEKYSADSTGFKMKQFLMEL